MDNRYSVNVSMETLDTVIFGELKTILKEEVEKFTDKHNMFHCMLHDRRDILSGTIKKVSGFSLDFCSENCLSVSKISDILDRFLEVNMKVINPDDFHMGVFNTTAFDLYVEEENK